MPRLARRLLLVIGGETITITAINLTTGHGMATAFVLLLVAGWFAVAMAVVR